MDKPPAPKPTINPETLSVLGRYMRQKVEDDVSRDFAQAMRAVKPPAKPPLKP